MLDFFSQQHPLAEMDTQALEIPAAADEAPAAHEDLPAGEDPAAASSDEEARTAEAPPAESPLYGQAAKRTTGVASARTTYAAKEPPH